MIDPYSLLNFKFLVCLLFLLSRHLNRYRHLLDYVLQALVNKSVNMVKQLYYSEIHSKNIEIYLSKLYTGKYILKLKM